jgi:hypothetical protein
MNLKFKLKEVIEVEIYSGFYNIFVLGGFDVQANPDFFVQILNIKTNEVILLKEKSLKARDYKHGLRAVKFFGFEVVEYGKYEISVHNYDDLIVKFHMPMLFSFLFNSLFFRLLTFRSAQKTIELDEIEILIS